jgi:HlyD family secretion protein
VYQGYLEGEYVYVAAPVGGALQTLAVARGDTVKPGQILFTLEQEAEVAAVREAEGRLAQAQARLANLRKGRRPTELAAFEAQRRRAEANLELSRAELSRHEELARSQVISPAELDLARARRDADQAALAALEAELETARLGAREDEVRAAEAESAAAEAALTRARWALTQKTQTAPASGRVHDTLFRAGELVPAGLPVVVLLPPESLKARFFVPETAVAMVKIGGTVTLRLDGRAQPAPARVSYVASQPEFTPPVIYSRENRAKLVFMVEARLAPEDAAGLHPGQPVEVSTAATAP